MSAACCQPALSLTLPRSLLRNDNASPLQHLTYCGERYKGRYTIAKHWHGLMKAAGGLGDVVLAVEHLDHQPLAGAVSAGQE